MSLNSRRQWRDLTPAQHAAIIVSAIVQFGLAAAAWTDLARQARERVRGPKWRWAALIAVNYAGPLAYFRWGRTPTVPGAGAGAATDATFRSGA
jgi:hypothetical protein